LTSTLNNHYRLRAAIVAGCDRQKSADFVEKLGFSAELNSGTATLENPFWSATIALMQSLDSIQGT